MIQVIFPVSTKSLLKYITSTFTNTFLQLPTHWMQTYKTSRVVNCSSSTDTEQQLEATARTIRTRASVWWRRVLVAVAAVVSAPVGVFASSSPVRPSGVFAASSPLRHSVASGGAMSAIPTATTDAVLVQSVEMPAGSVKIEGYDFNRGVDHNALLDSFIASGFQASNFGMAVEEINKMRAWSLADEPVAEDEDEEFKDPEVRKKVKTTIFLGYTSNMASCGVRETIRYLCQHKMVDAIVATAGGVEEDIIKCLAPTYLGSSNPLHPTVTSGFELDGKTLRLQVRGGTRGTRLRRACLPCSAGLSRLHCFFVQLRCGAQVTLGTCHQGLNRIGNLLVPNENYCKFEEWLMPLLDKMVDEQVISYSTLLVFLVATVATDKLICVLSRNTQIVCPNKRAHVTRQLASGTPWTPSTFIKRMGLEINNKESIYYW